MMLITPDEAREIITRSAREIFPSLLPLRLQEAREAILSHLNLEVRDFGYFPSGGAKFENYCSQVVKNLKATGEMRTEGWTWYWADPVRTPIEAPVAEAPVAEVIEMTMADLFEAPVATGAEAPSLYDLSCEETVIRLVASTPCFGSVATTDPECQGCPLFELCSEKRGENNQAKKIAREAKAEALKIASDAGYDLKKLKVPKSARLRDSYDITALSDTTCIASGEPILKDELTTIVPSWGAVKPIIVEALKAIEP
jgi:hypothetical protein